MIEAVVEIVPKVVKFGKRFVQVDSRRDELRGVLEDLRYNVDDLMQKVMNEEKDSRKKRKSVVAAYFSQVDGYICSAQSVLNSFPEESWLLKRMTLVPSIERLLREGQEHLDKGRQLREQGLTRNEIRKRGEMLPIEEDQYIGNTFSRVMDSAFEAMENGSVQSIGIYGNAGAGKTNLMKHLYNKALAEDGLFKAVFWAKAPDIVPGQGTNNYSKALQKHVAEGMWVDLEDSSIHDEARCAGKIMAKLEDIGKEIGQQCRAVFFLDDVKEDFSAHELLGIPSLKNTNNYVNCILVFTTLSKDICNRMKCELPLKMELLEEEEAISLFLHELKRGYNNDQFFFNQNNQRIKEIAIKVAKECARMPLVIIIIARSMSGIEDHREWNNRWNEMVGTVSSINKEDEIIIKQLKFAYICLEDPTVQRCFLDAAELLPNDSQLSKLEIINEWKNRGRIGYESEGHYVNDQGHVILNRLERMCLIQVAPDSPTITMNKWIRKMADTISMNN